MFKEKPLGIEPEEVPAAEGASEKSESREQSGFRKKFLTAMFLGSMALMEACGGMKKEEIEAMPETAIEDVQKEPEKFKEMPMIKVNGYPIRVGDDNVKYPVAVFKSVGKGIKFDHWDWVEKRVDVYDIHSTSDLKSQSIKGFMENGGTYITSGIPIDLEGKPLEPREYAIAGHLKSITIKGEKVPAIEIQGVAEKEQAPAEAPQQ